MKKIIAVLLCIMVCFSVCGSAQNASDEINSEVQYTELSVALNLLEQSALQRKKEKITRGEFTAAVVHLAGMTGEAKEYYSDVPLKHTYSREIAAAHEMGLIEGFGDGSFHPDEAATYAQALKMLVYLAGYKTMTDAGMSVERAARDDPADAVCGCVHRQ